MEGIRNLILTAFDIRKLSEECNFLGCRNSVESEVFIYEYTTQRRIGLAMLYLCKDHMSAAKDIIKRIKKEAPNKIIQSQIGRVAQSGRAHG